MEINDAHKENNIPSVAEWLEQEKQAGFIIAANEMFKGSKPIDGIEAQVLHDSIIKNAKRVPTLPNRL